jgi:outer membrane protein
MGMVKNKFLLVMAFALATIFVMTGSSIAADVKIGVMNVQKIIVQCDAGKAAKDRFEAKMKELQTKFKSEEDELKKLQAEIKKKSSVWNEEKKAEKVREFQKNGRELQAKTEDARFEMKQLQDKELEPILKSLEKVVNTYGAEKEYTAILDSKNVIYFGEAVDVTATIVQKLNKAMASN